MKKVIFGGFCMLSGLIGVFITLYTAYLAPTESLVVTIRRNFIGFIKVAGLMEVFVWFCLLTIIGLLFGLWGVFENDSK